MTTRSVMSRRVASIAVPRPILADAHAGEFDGALLAGLGHDLELEGLHLAAVESRRAVNILCMWPS